MLILFPEFLIRAGQVDPAFAEEWGAAVEGNFRVALYNEEALLSGDADRAVRGVPDGEGGIAILRGWMMRSAAYGQLHTALLLRGWRLINDEPAYAESHYLPLAYPILEGRTPASAWTDAADVETAWGIYQPFRERDAMVKDWVKSAKNRWREACFIPAGTGRARFVEILAALVEERGRLFERGFVIREFVPLVSEGIDMRGHPADREVRLFFLNGEIMVRPQPRFLPEATELESFCGLARRFRSRFLTMDLAETTAGGWTVIEVGDGGVSGLPVSLMADMFYGAMRRVLGRSVEGI